MVISSAANQSDNLELASFGEVVYAFTSMQTTRRRRITEADPAPMPWRSEETDALQAAAKPEPAMQKAAQNAPAAETDSKLRRNTVHCRCGKCSTCADNLRWERIFQEKFASPDYYRTEIRVRYASPLSGC
jgi:hypothetical protein